MQVRPPDEPRSPCVSECQLDAWDVCVGCLRTREEVGRWSVASVTEKRQILSRLQARRVAQAKTMGDS